MAKKTKPLTAAEKKWLGDVKALMAQCPSSRLSAFTIGDACITIYDNGFDDVITEGTQDGKADFGTLVEELDCELDHIAMPFPVHSTAG